MKKILIVLLLSSTPLAASVAPNSLFSSWDDGIKMGIPSIVAYRTDAVYGGKLYVENTSKPFVFVASQTRDWTLVSFEGSTGSYRNRNSDDFAFLANNVHGDPFITAMPELEPYIMLLAGFGMVGTVVSRRQMR
ncbi:MAG: hypothetical protein FWD51_02470 [Betaproteobacteria bacterium]|nr:hypothetical protein [Betaproteobacteria bacterium]